MGARLDGEGTNFAVFSANATQIEVCLFSPDGKTEIAREKLPERSGHIWHGYAQGLQAGALYGLRAHGNFAPDLGHRFNANKLLIDPYSREFHGRWTNHSTTFGYNLGAPNADLSFDSRDSAAHMPKSVISDERAFAPMGPKPAHEWDELFIYEAHVKGLTQQHPDIDAALRGSYEALSAPAMLDHLHKLNVTAIELMPVQSFIDDNFLLKRGLTNYWGYNTIGFFAPEPRYFGPQGIAGFRAMVQRFHDAGIEVILDVVYNHTAEGDELGPTLCYRGLDNASYYRLQAGHPRYYVNDTGCGNTFNLSNPHVLRLVMDSLRFWVEQMGVDGFRFDLATTLAREDHGFAVNGGFIKALRQDPVLASARLIAEPWDIGPGGYQLGEFPSEFAEWNDNYRDSARRFWKGDAHSAQDLAANLLGTAGQFDRQGRRAWSSVNFLAAHDGFTLADTTRYHERHNLANGENNRDGHHGNHSDNFGVEGETDDATIIAQRQLRQRNMLATLFLSQGTPMLWAGDEIENSQSGNNNAYCQDNALGWVNWDMANTEQAAFVARLTAFRKAHPALRQTRFLHGLRRFSDGLPDVEWSDFEGEPLDWRDPHLAQICLILRGSAEAPASFNDTVLIAINRDDDPATLTLPSCGTGHHWQRALDTAQPSGGNSDDLVVLAAHSVTAFIIVKNKALLL
jgi:isoamylase